jgi:hypothetical protein
MLSLRGMRLRNGVSFALLFLSSTPASCASRLLPAPTCRGKPFGDAGAHERITGRIYFSLPIANPHNHRIVDLGNAVNLKKWRG